MDQELTFVRRELATNTFWLRSYGTIRKSFTSCQTSCLSRQSMQGKWQITRPIRLRGAACWDMQSHRVNAMQQQSNTLQEAFCSSSQCLFKDPSTCICMQHSKTTVETAACWCSSCLQMQTARGSAEHGDSCGRMPVTFPGPSLSLSLCHKPLTVESLFGHSI